jgi:hypothetical protein
VILVAAAAILSWRPPEPEWAAAASAPAAPTGAAEPKGGVPLVVRVAPLPEAGTPVPVVEPSPAAAPAPGAAAQGVSPLELLTAADARPAGAVAADPPAPAPAPAPAVAEAAAPVPAPAPDPAPVPFAVAVPHDPVQTQLAMAGIAAEVERKRAEVAQTAALRDSVLDLERRRLAEQMEAERRAAEEHRVTFRRELARLLQQQGDGAGAAIWALAESRHAEPSPVAEKAIAAAIQGAKAKGKLDRAGRVAIFRAYGLDETVILAELVREQVGLMPSRRGPRTREEAIVRAARALLALRPEAAPAPALKATARN